MPITPQQTWAYSGRDVFFTFGGVVATGLGEGDDAIRVQPQTEAGTLRVGVGGSAVVSIQQDLSAMVTLRLLRTSPMNDLLQKNLNLWRVSGLMLPLLVKDTRGREMHSCAKAFIERQPESQHGKNSSDIEWTFVCPVMRSNQGGY